MNQLKLKKVEQEDWNTIVLIRNDPIVRKASINDPIETVFRMSVLP